MATRQVAFATPAILKWAREQSGYTVEDAAEAARIGKPDKLSGAEAGTGHLSMRELERLAKAYQRSVAFFFLANAPGEAPVETQFRRLRDAPGPPWPPALRHLVRAVRERQDDAIALLEALEQPPRWPEAQLELSRDAEVFGSAIREVLDLPQPEMAAHPMRTWVDAIEDLGVLVMQSGDVPLAITRGFASPDPLVPAIVLNTKDDYRARIFTALHELVHLVHPQPPGEGWIEQAAGAAFMPSATFDAAFRRARRTQPTLLSAAEWVAAQYGASPRAAATRARQRELLTWDELNAVYRELDLRPAPPASQGGNYYRNVLTWLGPAFTRLVLTAFDAQAVNFTTASGMLDGVKVTKFPGLRRHLEQRAGLV
jgi:Zn-dependent peptidase ImmA (M78 family)